MSYLTLNDGTVPSTPPAGKTRVWADGTGALRVVNDAGADKSPSAPGHTHVEGDVTALVADLAGKAPVSHTHAESDVTNLTTDLAAKAPNARQIATTAPLGGGGDLSADRTLTIANYTVDSGAGGAKGAVPAPAAGDGAANKVLKAGSGWTALAESDVTSLVSDLAAKAPTARTIATTLPLTGGGDLSANRTLDVNNFGGDAGAGGTKGTVPAPAAGDATAGLAGKFLKASGGWAIPPIQMLNAKDYGAVGDGSADDTTAIQNAINAAAALQAGRGRGVFLPAGIYKVTAALTILSSNFILAGESVGATVILADGSLTNDTIQIGNGSGTYASIILRDFQIYASSSHTAGSFINVNKANDVTIENFSMNNPFTGITVQGASIKVYIRKGTLNAIRVTTGVGIQVTNGAAGDTYISDIIISNSPASMPAAGIQITQSGHFNITRCNITSCTKGLHLNPGASQDVTYGFVTDTLFDSCGSHGLHVNPTNASGRVRSMVFTGSWFAGSTANYGIEIGGVASSTVNGIRFSNCRILNNWQHGVLISYASATYIVFDGCHIVGNGQAAANTWDAINCVANVNGVDLTDCILGGAVGTAAANQQRYGLNLAAGTSADWMLSGNDWSGNGTAPGYVFAPTGVNVQKQHNHPEAGHNYTNTLAGTAATSGTGDTAILASRIPANSVKAGDTFEVECHGISSSTGTVIWRIHIGPSGVVGDATAWVSITSAAQVANQRTGFKGLVKVISIGAPGSALAEAVGYAQAAVLPTVVAAQANVTPTTTADWFITISCTCSSGTVTAYAAIVKGA
jgi:hypothetical protein